MDPAADPKPVPPTLDSRMVRTREALHAALLALLEEERPFEQVTVREITARAEIGYATFFRHYPDKETLLRDLAAEQIDSLLGMALPVLDTKGSATASLALCSYVAEHDRLWNALLAGGAAATMREAFIRAARKLAQAQDKPASWLPHDLDVVWSVGGTIDILAWWLRQPERLPVARVAEILNRLVIEPTLQAR